MVCCTKQLLHPPSPLPGEWGLCAGLPPYLASIPSILMGAKGLQAVSVSGHVSPSPAGPPKRWSWSRGCSSHWHWHRLETTDTQVRVGSTPSHGIPLIRHHIYRHTYLQTSLSVLLIRTHCKWRGRFLLAACFSVRRQSRDHSLNHRMRGLNIDYLSIHLSSASTLPSTLLFSLRRRHVARSQ